MQKIRSNSKDAGIITSKGISFENTIKNSKARRTFLTVNRILVPNRINKSLLFKTTIHPNLNNLLNNRDSVHAPSYSLEIPNIHHPL